MRSAIQIVCLGVSGLAVLFASEVALAQTTRPALPTSPRDVRGVSWSDPRDNYNPSSIVPAKLSQNDTPERAAEIAAEYARRVLALDVNVVRLGINPPTVDDPTWWPVYERVIRTLCEHGLGVILCAWEQSPDVHRHGRGQHNGRFGAGSVDSYAAMWTRVHERLRDEKNVIGYELLNEPFGYEREDRAEYVRDMRKLMAAIGDDLNGKQILVAGMGYSDNVQVLKDAFPESHVWFALHVYPNWWGGEWRDHVLPRERYAEELAKSLAGVESRTVITEFGCWGGPAYDYSRPSDQQKFLNAERHVAYLQGIVDTCEAQQVGSIYWTANANHTGDDRTYDLIDSDGKPIDLDRLEQVWRAWRVKREPAKP